MKKRVFCMALALVLTLGLAVPVFAEEETSPVPEYRLVGMSEYNGEYNYEDDYVFSYDEGGYLPTRADGRVTWFTAAYDDAGRVVSLSDSTGVTSTYEYGGNGELLVSSHHFDEIYTKEGTVTTADDSSVYTYDDRGNRVRIERTYVVGGETQDASAYEYVYDGSGAVQTRKTYRDGLVSARSEYSYDDAGDLVRVKTGYNAYEYTYDAKGNMLSETYYENGAVSTETTYVYDEEGRKIQEDFTSDYASRSSRYVYTPLLTFELRGDQNGSSLLYHMCDSEGVDLLSAFIGIDYTGEPQFTYDDNGYITQVAFENGSSVSFTYEPVA